MSGRRWPKYVATLLVLAIAVALFVLATEPFFGPTNRFRVIMAAVLSDTLAIVWLLAKNFELIGALQSQHRAASHVNTARGLIATLEIQLASGGLPLATRRKVYAAINEQFSLYDEALAGRG